MCVVALALHQHPDWPILLAGNRDELHARASAPLHMWDDDSGIIAGRDLVGGGTWLGVQPKAQRVVVVTNARSGDAPDPDKHSRGVLVRDLLTGTGDFAAPDVPQLGDFNGFNLIAVQSAAARVMTNRPDAKIRALGSGMHALANEIVDHDCPRAARLAAVVQHWLAAGDIPETLLDALGGEEAPALFLNGPVYGTRCSTLIAVGADGAGLMIERRFGPERRAAGETRLVFRWGG